MTPVEELIRLVEELQKRLRRLEALERSRASLVVTDGVTAPTAVSGYAFIYVDGSDGDLKCLFGDNVTKTIVTDT